MSYQEQLLKSIGSEYLLTKSNYERYLERFRYGSASISDVLDASDSLRSAQTRLLSCKRDLLNASMMLMIALGGDSFTKQEPTAVPNNGVSEPVDVYAPEVILLQATQEVTPVA